MPSAQMLEQGFPPLLQVDDVVSQLFPFLGEVQGTT